MENEKLKKIYEIMKDHKLLDVKVYNLKGTTPFYDYFIIGTGNLRQIDATSTDISQQFKNDKGIEGKQTNWVLIDLNEVVVHLFDKEARDNYGLDKMFFNLLDKEYSDD